MHYDHTILLAHGSRDPQWSEPFRRLTEQIRGREPALSLAFMELSEPSLESVLLGLSERPDVHSVAVLPLFFAAGRHLREDVPGQLAALASRIDLSVTLLPPIGEEPRFVAFLQEVVIDLVRHAASE